MPYTQQEFALQFKRMQFGCNLTKNKKKVHES